VWLTQQYGARSTRNPRTPAIGSTSRQLEDKPLSNRFWVVFEQDVWEHYERVS
jgi:hypothetical protein